MRVKLVGLITTAVALLAWGFCFLVGRRAFADGRTAIVMLDDAYGIATGTKVTYLGLQIGTVDRLSIHDGKIIAEIRIHEKGAELRKGDHVRVKDFGIFGDHIIDLVPGPRSLPLVGAGDTLIAMQARELPIGSRIEAFMRELDKRNGTGQGGATSSVTRQPPPP